MVGFQLQTEFCGHVEARSEGNSGGYRWPPVIPLRVNCRISLPSRRGRFFQGLNYSKGARTADISLRASSAGGKFPRGTWETLRRQEGWLRLPEVQWTGARLIAVLSLLGQQRQFHAFAFASQRGGPFFASPLVDPLQPLPNPLQPLPNPLQSRDPLPSFRHAMPGNCQSKYSIGLSA